MDSKFVEVGALWIREKNGKQYLSGKLKVALAANSPLIIFKNDYKNKENQPDYKVSGLPTEEIPPYNPEGPKKVIAAVQGQVTEAMKPGWEDDVPF